MLWLRRVGRFIVRIGGWRVRLIGSSLRSQLSAAPFGYRDGGDGMFEDQLLLCAGLKQDGKLIEAADTAAKLGAIDEINHYHGFITTNGVEKRILDVLWRRPAV